MEATGSENLVFLVVLVAVEAALPVVQKVKIASLQAAATHEVRLLRRVLGREFIDDDDMPDEMSMPAGVVDQIRVTSGRKKGLSD